MVSIRPTHKQRSGLWVGTAARNDTNAGEREEIMCRVLSMTMKKAMHVDEHVSWSYF